MRKHWSEDDGDERYDRLKDDHATGDCRPTSCTWCRLEAHKTNAGFKLRPAEEVAPDPALADLPANCTQTTIFDAIKEAN